jgi:hypothetical protein
MGAGITWDLNARPYDVVFTEDDPPACPRPGTDPDAVHFDSLLRSAISPDGRTRALSRDGRAIVLVDLRTGGVTPLPPLGLAGNERIAYFFFSKDGRSLVVNLETPSEDPDEFRCRNGVQIGSVVIAIEGAISASPRLGEVAVSSSESGRLLFTSPDRTVIHVRSADLSEHITFAADLLAPDPTLHSVGNLYTIDWTGTRVAGTNATGEVVVWTVTNGHGTRLPKPAVERTADLNLVGIAFSRNDRLAVKAVDQSLRVYDLSDLSAQPRLKQLPTDARARVTYSPDDELIAVDGTYLFDSATLRQVGPRLKPSEWSRIDFDIGTQAQTFVTQGNALYLVSERTGDMAAVAWRLDVGSLRAQACAFAGRNLTSDEYHLYVSASGRPTTCTAPFSPPPRFGQ